MDFSLPVWYWFGGDESELILNFNSIKGEWSY
jgi:hypothetical protein